MVKKTALVAGATGLVGSHLIDELAANEHYSKIIALSRRPVKNNNPKIENKLIDFEQINNLPIDENIDECFCCLGTTQKKLGKKGLYKVDYEYVISLAEICNKNSIPKLLIVSSQGANARSSFFYMRTKGKMETDVLKIDIPSIIIVRPSLITGKREERRWTEEAGYILYKLLQPLFIGKLRKMRAVSALQIAKSLIKLASENKKGKLIIESDYIQKF
jgi:uncharacterized protein YbjT (DUF2867 family)